jgi:hypothetical protein
VRNGLNTAPNIEVYALKWAVTPIGHSNAGGSHTIPRREIALSSGPTHTVAKGILVYGSDEILLSTRTMVLENAGFRVLSAINYADAEAIIRSGEVALVVLCHSLNADDREAILRLVSGLSPSVSTVVLTAGASLISERSPTGIVSAFDGPRKLIESVHKLLLEPSGT